MVRLSRCLDKPHRHPHSHSRFVILYVDLLYLFFFTSVMCILLTGGLLICTARIGRAVSIPDPSRVPFYKHGLILIPAWMSNYIYYELLIQSHLTSMQLLKFGMEKYFISLALKLIDVIKRGTTDQ